MIESPLTPVEQKRLRDAFDHLRRAFELLEQTVKDYETEHEIEGPSQRQRIFEIVRSNNYTADQKVERIAEIMRSYNFLCQLDDLRTETMYLSEHFTKFVESGIFQPSDTMKIRSGFYEILSALFVADMDLGGIEPP